MPLLSPAFREINYSRIRELINAECSCETIASVLTDENPAGVKFTASDVRGYLKVQGEASVRMLVSQKKMRALRRTSTVPEPV
ncbi:hypothetical protein A9C11_20480 [Pseudomonas citronellolis]|uniref:Uncharacterized protein n=1 Tax=Pseudomonas citronellolis TaxID=53408 RepID=A0A1A9KEF9_9PSED|nr:hypothetical protein A9C11_20480 [Pseudomonas citronellolis]KSE80630.1 hypothetical protein AO924_21555 [Pseudomonas aeruginosa]KSN11552.1 hypothetical protein APA79_00280 [Pseudomonas aeruginosa]PXA55802.1 hypothetical protein DMC54_21680 [Pseudomonas aeruginosa]